MLATFWGLHLFGSLLWLPGGGGYYGKFFVLTNLLRKTSAMILKSDGKNCATLSHGEGQGARWALLTEGAPLEEKV